MNAELSETMVNVNIALPQSMKAFVDAEVRAGGYGTTDEYIRDLVREAEERKADERLETLLLEAIESGPATPMTKQDWEDMRNELTRRAEQRLAEQGKQ